MPPPAPSPNTPQPSAAQPAAPAAKAADLHEPTILDDVGAAAGEPPALEGGPKPEGEAVAEPPPPGGPAEYTDFTMPDGFSMDGDTMAAGKALFKELGLSQEGAQKLVDFWTSKVGAAMDAPYQTYAETRKGWRDAVKAEHGQNMDAVKGTIGRLYSALEGATRVSHPTLIKDFRAAVTLTGSGDHPAFVNVMYQLGKALGEGSLVLGAGPSPHGQVPGGRAQRPSLAQSMYPNLTSSES